MHHTTLMPIMDDICTWLRANGIEPDHIPLWAVPTITDDLISVFAYQHRDGQKFVDPETDDLAMDLLTVPLVTPPPAVLNRWLAGELRAPRLVTLDDDPEG